MEEKKEERERNRADPEALSPTSRTRSYSLKDKLLMALIIIAIISLGLLAVNQFVQWRYNSLLLQTPCELCRNMNPSIDFCFKEIESGKINKNQYTINPNFTLPVAS